MARYAGRSLTSPMHQTKDIRPSRNRGQDPSTRQDRTMKKPQRTSIPWNLFTKNIVEDEFLRKKLNGKIAKLEKHLSHFPPGTVHLQIVLERNVRKLLYSAALTLRIPSNILRSEKSARDIIKAIDDAVKALLRELEPLKARLRREPRRKGKEPREQLRERNTSATPSHPGPEGAGPRELREGVREILQQHYARLVRHVRRHLRHDELAGDIPPGSLDARDIVDEVARQAAAENGRKAGKINPLVGFYRLIHLELRRQRGSLKQKRVEQVSLHESRELADDAETAAGYGAEHPLDIIIDEIEPRVVETRVLIADPNAPTPEQVVESTDVLEPLQGIVRKWSRPERDVFELHFVEGFEPEEIAMIAGSTFQQVQENIISIQRRLREETLRQ